MGYGFPHWQTRQPRAESRVQSGVVAQRTPFDSGQRSLSVIAQAGASRSAKEKTKGRGRMRPAHPSLSSRQREESWRPTHRLLGIMQCTPLRTSTTWLTRQSPAIAVSE